MSITLENDTLDIEDIDGDSIEVDEDHKRGSIIFTTVETTNEGACVELFKEEVIAVINYLESRLPHLANRPE